jgi:hypothetical protein
MNYQDKKELFEERKELHMRSIIEDICEKIKCQKQNLYSDVSDVYQMIYEYVEENIHNYL